MAPLRRTHCWPLSACAAETAEAALCLQPLSPTVPPKGAFCSKPWLRLPGCPLQPCRHPREGLDCKPQSVASNEQRQDGAGSSAPSVTQGREAPPLGPPHRHSRWRVRRKPGPRGAGVGGAPQALPGPPLQHHHHLFIYSRPGPVECHNGQGWAALGRYAGQDSPPQGHKMARAQKASDATGQQDGLGLLLPPPIRQIRHLLRPALCSSTVIQDGACAVSLIGHLSAHIAREYAGLQPPSVTQDTQPCLWAQPLQPAMLSLKRAPAQSIFRLPVGQQSARSRWG